MGRRVGDVLTTRQQSAYIRAEAQDCGSADALRDFDWVKPSLTLWDARVTFRRRLGRGETRKGQCPVPTSQSVEHNNHNSTRGVSSEEERTEAH